MIKLNKTQKIIFEGRIRKPIKTYRALSKEVFLTPGRCHQIFKGIIKAIEKLSIDEDINDEGVEELCRDAYGKGLSDIGTTKFHIAFAIDSISKQRIASLLRYYYGMWGGRRATIRELSEFHNISPSRIRQLMKQGLITLKSPYIMSILDIK